MSVIACVTIYECDGENCKAVFPLKDDESWKNFEELWYSGLLYQFCPECRFKPSAITNQQLEVQAFYRLLSIHSVSRN